MLRGKSVVLRPVRREDVLRLWELLGEDLALRALVSAGPPLPRSRAHLEEEIERGVHEEHPAAKFVVEVDGEVVGRCELHSFDQHSRHCQLGIALGRPHWGRGYGQDAVGVLCDYAFRHLNVHRVYLHVLAHDERAVGSYRKAGFVEEGRLRQHAWHEGRYRDVLVMAVLRPEGEGDPLLRPPA